jgi:hypothetical protein
MAEPESGVHSLGTIQPRSIDGFLYHPSRKEPGAYRYRLRFTDKSGQYYHELPITDLALRFFVDYLREHDGRLCGDVTKMMNQTLTNCDQLWLRLGLTRPFHKRDDEPAYCYLQVNGIYTFPDYLSGRCFADFRTQAV